MALTGQTGRLVADPTIGVEDITGVFEKWLKSRKTRNFFKALNLPRGLTFKKPKKIRTALAKMNEQDEKINHTRKSDNDFVDLTDEGIRIGCAMFRCLKVEAKTKQRCFAMMTAAEQAAVQDVIDIMNCGPVLEDGSQESVSEPPPGMLALADGAADARPADASLKMQGLRLQGPWSWKTTLGPRPKPSLHRLDPMAVFDRVRSRVSSEEAESEDLPGPSSSSRAPPDATTSTSSPMDVHFSFLLSQAESVELLDNKAQLIIFRKNCPEKKGKGKGKQNGEANKKSEANQKTENAIPNKSRSSAPSKVKKAIESPDGEAPEISEEKDTIPAIRHSKKSPDIPKSKESPKSKQSDPKAKATPKSTPKSKASPRSTPKSKATAKAKGDQFDSENPKEKKAKLKLKDMKGEDDSECVADAANPEGADKEPED
ncbi:des [Symbiodinium sp. CCMP2592]|nr:des [Symbiodinium sp. CCMP2592]